MAPREGTLHSGIIQLLLHFQWTWIGLIVSDDENGEKFLQVLTPLLAHNSICVAFLERSGVPKNPHLQDHTQNRYLQNILSVRATLLLTEANVVIVDGNSHSLAALAVVLYIAEFTYKSHIGKVWITSAQWDFTNYVDIEGFCARTFHGTLSFTTSISAVLGFQDFLQTLKPDTSLTRFLCVFYKYAFRCCHDGGKFKNCQHCTGEEKLENLPQSLFKLEMSDQSYHIYNGLYAVAHALHALHMSRQRTMLNRDAFKLPSIEQWQVYSSLY